MNENAGKQVLIVKRSGEREPFDDAKLRHSLKKAMASPDMIDDIIRNIQSELKEGMTTSEIYRHAFSLLKKYHVPLAARYSLKQGIMDLGPKGRRQVTILWLNASYTIV